MKKIVRSFTTVLCMFISSIFIIPMAHASIDVTDESDSSSLFIRLEENSSRSNTRSNPGEERSSTGTVAPPPPAPSTNSGSTSSEGNSGGGGSTPIVGPIPSGLAPEARAICSSIGIRMMNPLVCQPETVAAPAPPPAPAAPAPQQQVVSEPVTITITSSDLLELIPNSPQILMDRGPFGLKNAHTNFYASHHEPQTITQTMFDQEVTITATPVEYRWEYGDGNTLVTDLPGYPVDIFNTETDTSHQFEETGTYSVELTTVFEGTFQVDGGEVQEVSSTVTQQADPVEIRIYRAVTRNVDQTCAENPDAWGCELPE